MNRCRVFAPALGALFLCLAAPPLQAWGTKGHEIINGAAVGALPAKSGLKAFFQANQEWLAKRSNDADHDKKNDSQRREKSEALEGPRHFLDLDAYGTPPFADLPEDYDAAALKFGKNKIDGQGTLPWRIEEIFDRLVQALQKENGDAILKNAAWLGHYVGDAHVPFHAALNYDGQLSGQKGVHAWFEERVVDSFVTTADIRPAPADRSSSLLRPRALAFGWLREGYALLDPILKADADHGGKSDKGAARDLAGFGKTATPLAIAQLSKAATRLAGLWHAAYQKAGSPDLAGLCISEPAAAAAGAALIGNSRSKIFHTPACAGLPAERNRIVLRSRETADKQGYTPCPQCKP